MVRIRMKRLGRRRRPFYRINAIDITTKRDGKVLEQLGWYDPLVKDESKQLVLNEERIKDWLARGARPSDTLMDMLSKRNLVDADKWKAVRAARVARKLKMAALKPAAPVADKKADAKPDDAAKPEAEKPKAEKAPEKSEAKQEDTKA